MAARPAESWAHSLPEALICPVRSFSDTSPCISRPLSGFGFRPAAAARFTSPKSLARVLEFLFYLWCRSFRWVFLIPNRLKHLPAHGLVLNPFREAAIQTQADIDLERQKTMFGGHLLRSRHKPISILNDKKRCLVDFGFDPDTSRYRF